MARYRLECRCLLCRAARSEYVRQLKESGPTWVPVDRARAHLHSLYAKGITRAEIARQSGISESWLSRVDGTDGRNGKPQRRIAVHVEEAILAVRDSRPGNFPTRVTASRVYAALDAMRPMGYKRMSAETGVSTFALWAHYERKHDRIEGITALKILDAAARLGFLRPAADRERYEIHRAEGLAPKDAAEAMGISARTAWRLERAS